MASLAGSIICIILNPFKGWYIFLFFLITILGFFVSDRMEDIVGQKDPSCIVVDEVSGVMISFFALPFTPAVFFTTFFLFRAFDMFKIYPVNKWEDKKGGIGVMMDDVVAGLYTNITMQIAIRLANII